ncbi:Uncharacterized protein PECH_001847 [Penicillium ucsense]|uniref:COP9 signalosome complex subunit 3 N-terminal helical repeats domain-containing protein n=1 Tax=Penicillium ucsense TaxID=2839758 RepID=A0A8J8VX01_9EURO|nr:Uncharacterized protein PECM_001980 [Penicillium ucsense]KAF7732225.1 Uncharacterized protein PECH_001847 [Penicillium ucsense]
MSVLEGLRAQSAQLHEASRNTDAAYDQQIRQNVASLREAVSAKYLGDLTRDESLLDHIDPTADSLLYLYILRAQIQIFQEESRQSLPAVLLPTGWLWSKIVSYLKSFNPVQSRYVGEEWRQVVELVAQIAQASSQPLLAARVVRDAMLRLDPSCTVFTSTHLVLVRLCLRARAYSCALPVLDKYVCHFPSSQPGAGAVFVPILCASHDSSLSFITEKSGLSAKLTYKDHLQYYLYGGMIYMALKQWTKAIHFLQIVISMPTTASVSMIMVEAYKKWILANLLEKGKLPSTTNLMVTSHSRVYQSLAKPYVSLAQAFESGDLKRIEEEIEAARDVWHADHNLGLVSQVHCAYTKHTVERVKKTFAALTVDELLHQSPSMQGSNQVPESTIASLIMSGAVSATLVQPSDPTQSTMVRFTESRSSTRLVQEREVQLSLAREGQALRTLSKSLGDLDSQLGLSNEVIDSLKRSQAWTAVGEPRPGTSEDAGVDMDEDLMGEDA